MLIQRVEEVIFHFMSAVWLNVMFTKMKLGHLYLLYMYIEVGNKMRIFDFYTILLSIIMTMRTKCWNQNWNHESCHFDVVQPCRFVYVLEMFNVVQMKKKDSKRRDDFVSFKFLHLCCYLLSTKDTQLSRPQLIE